MTDVKITTEVRAHLATLENERGQLTPTVVVDDAKREESPLHGMFDWNIESAAAKYWLQQARVIIHSVRVVQTSTQEAVSIPYYVRDPSVSSDQQGYVSVASLRNDPEQARESVRLEFGRAESALTRARSVAAALNMTDEIDGLINRLVGMRESLAKPADDHSAAA